LSLAHGIAQDDDLADLETVVDETATVGARDDRDLEDRVVDDLEVGAGQRARSRGDVEGPARRERRHGGEYPGQRDGRRGDGGDDVAFAPVSLPAPAPRTVSVCPTANPSARAAGG
jgi:hypothetical protein